MTKQPAVAATDGSSRRAVIVAAALRRIERNGAARTTMRDIAEAAGISRITLYRAFRDRAALFEAILTDRFAAMLDALGAVLAGCDSFAEALLEGGDRSIELARADALLPAIIEATDRTLERFILENTPALRARQQQVWAPSFAAARASGELRAPVPDERLIEGMRSILVLLLLRTDMTRAERRRFIGDFIVLPMTGVYPEDVNTGSPFAIFDRRRRLP